MSYDEFMDSNFYYYFGLAEQWLISNGAKKENAAEKGENEPTKVRYFDELPKGYW